MANTLRSDDRHLRRLFTREGAVKARVVGNFDLPAGANHDVYFANCTSCHTSRYVTNQPNFPRKVWEAEVTKMVKAYGAPIDDEKQKLIVDYLMTVRGAPDPAPAPATSPAAPK